MTFRHRAFATVLASLFAGVLSACKPTTWTAPANPDMTKILVDATVDRHAKRNEIALLKHTWLHNFVHQGGAAQHPLWLGAGLAELTTLAGDYPPARALLVTARDQAEQQALEKPDTEHWFIDAMALNKSLGEMPRTVQLFQKLDASHPERAQLVYHHAQEALLAAGQYKLCAKYVNADIVFANLRQSWRQYSDMAAQGNQSIKDALPVIRDSFTRESSILVALLVLNDKPKDATRIAAEARRDVDDAAFAAQLDSALAGKLPPTK